MHNSDDYFTDDIVFDEQTLAVLDEEELKFAQSARIPPNPPPTKRQKTDHGWKVARIDSLNDLEDLPEISVQDDGSYGLGSSKTTRVSNIEWGNAAPTSHSTATSVGSSSGHRHALNASAAPPPRGARHIPAHPPGRAPSSYGRPSSQNWQPQQPQRQSSFRNDSVAGPRTSQRGSSTVVQVDDFRKQMEEMKAALQEAVNVSLTKEGEVAILRKIIEKAAQDTAAQVAKLRGAKEEADAKLVQARREMKEEMERMRTQATFKQHEIETSVRKPPWSVRSKKIRDVPSTPFPVLSQMRGWNMDGAGPSKFGNETPRRSDAVSPRAGHSRRRDGSERAKESGALPGFHNAFMPSSPVISSQIRRGKEKKEREETDLPLKAKGKEVASFLTYPSQFTSNVPPPNSPPSSPTFHRGLNGNGAADMNMQDDVYDGDGDDGALGDVEMLDDENDVQFLDTHDGFEPVNWKEELPRIILTHTLPSTTSLTIQTLLTATLPASLPASSANTYSSACSRVLEIIAATSKYQDWEESMNRLASSLIRMAEILNIAHSIPPLTALLNLLTLLICSMPSFSSSLLSLWPEEDPNQQSPPLIITVWCDIVQDQLAPRKPADENRNITSLGQETIGFIDALCWNVSDEFVDKLGFISRSPKALSTLLDSSQPLWLIDRGTRLLVILASYPTLFRHLLAFPDTEPPKEERSGEDFSRIPHIETLCSYLVDEARQGEEAESMRIHILIFFAMLSTSHADALTILLESQSLIPSLVLFLFHLTTPLWEDHETLMTSPALTASAIRTVNQTVFLLHHLVFSQDPVCNLRHKLYHAPHRQFNGISHMFIVGLGRLSYADAPEWVDRPGKLELEKLAEMARDLLDLVVEGPECDIMWTVYQGDTDQKSDTDDEEMEARNLHSNEI